MIRLRPWKKEDFQELMEWFSDEEAFYKWSAGKFDWPLTERQLLDYYGQFEKDQRGWILAALDDEGRLAGHLLMRKADYGKKSIHFGFIVVSPRLRGMGAGRAMVSQALKYAGEILGMERVTLGVFENNPAARRCYFRCVPVWGKILGSGEYGGKFAADLGKCEKIKGKAKGEK